MMIYISQAYLPFDRVILWDKTIGMFNILSKCQEY